MVIKIEKRVKINYINKLDKIIEFLIKKINRYHINIWILYEKKIK
jgi:hypothetical protein